MYSHDEKEIRDRIVAQRRQLAQDIVTRVCGSRYSEALFSGLVMEPANIEKVSSWIKSRKNMLVFTGSPGCGKTYFCAALIKYCWEKFESCRYWKEADLIRRLHDIIQQDGDYIKGLQLLTDDELVIFDDLGSTGFTDWRKEVIFEFVDYRYVSQKPTVITSNLTAKEIGEIFHPRILSRLFDRENTIIEVRGVDRRSE